MLLSGLKMIPHFKHNTMQGYNFKRSKAEINEAIRRNKRLGIKHTNQAYYNSPVSQQRSFLEWYVFENLGTSPMDFLNNIHTQYYAEQDFRTRRQRNVEFVRGRHFNEPVYDAEIQRTITNFEYLKRRNIPPLTYNVVSKLVRSLTGQFREINTGNIVKCDSNDGRGTEIASLLTKCIDRIKQNNRAKSKDAMNFKEMLISGSPVYKAMWTNFGNTKKPDIKFRIVNRANFLINPGIVDYDLDNLHTITEIHNSSLNDIIGSFANGDYERGMEIRSAYINYYGNKGSQVVYSSQSWEGSQMRNNMFQSYGSATGGYRYYEIWTEISDYEAVTFDPLDGIGTWTTHKLSPANKIKQMVDEANEERLQNIQEGIEPEDVLIRYKTDFVQRWYAIYMTEFGMVLDVRESPYKTSKHPYVFTPPDINGEVWGIVEEVLNAQLSLDRQILQADAIVSNASKGVWLVPDTAVPDTHTHKSYLQELKKVDGAVIYKVRDGFEDMVPKQIYANSANVSGNVQQLIQLYANLIDEISGNYGAAQGRGGDSGSSKTATGYALESQNAGLNVRDILENYLTMLVDRDQLILDFIIEGYTRSDYQSILGIPLEPREIREHIFTIEQSKGTNSPAHRLALEQELLNLVYNQLLPFEIFLDISNNPVMNQAKLKLQEYQKKMAEQQQMAMEAQAQANAKSFPERENAKPPQFDKIPQDTRAVVAGTPQGAMLRDQNIRQQLPKLPGLNI